MILKKYTNDLLEAVVNTALDVNKFSFEKVHHSSLGWVAKFNYSDTPELYFNLFGIQGQKDRFTYIYSTFTPGFAEITGGNNIAYDAVKESFLNWVDNDVKLYLTEKDTPDYWEIIKENPLKIEGIDFDEDNKFTAKEQKKLGEALEETKVIIQQHFELSEDQLHLVATRFKYLLGASKRTTKLDWKFIAYSTIGWLANDLLLDPEKTQVLFNLFSKVFSIVQQLPPGLPGLHLPLM